MARRINRRQVLKAATLGYAVTYIPRRAWGANDRIYLAGIGVGGKGAGEVEDLTAEGAQFVALCDVDADRAAGTFRKHPDAKVYKDFRVMLEKEKGIDGVTVSTPDHTHAVASLTAMAMGKHVYCQKPLTHSIFEARVMARAADHYKVATQMGNQAHAGEPIRRAVEVVRAGVIGPVREVHCWTNRPIWPQGQAALAERDKLASQSVPAGLDWDLWLGPAKVRPYNACYVPFKWRGWWDFGTGALGDMACHIMDMPYWALDLGSPESVIAESGGKTKETGPDWSTITYQFAARKAVGGGNRGGSVGPASSVAQPPVKFVWYDGVRDGRPNAPYELLQRAVADAAKAKAQEPSEPQAGNRRRNQPTIDSPAAWDLILVGDEGLMLFNRGSENWIITPAKRAENIADIPKTIARVANEDAEWLAAIKGGPKALSSFDYAGPFTEMVLLGNLAVRLGKKITWNSELLKAENAPEAEPLIRTEYRQGWELPVAKELLQIG
ncbi:MAG: Gfo/Idh/MocA family protein [Aureliella sp.]